MAKRVDRAVAVIGAGIMGHGIAHVLARAGTEVRLHDAKPDALSAAVTRIELELDRAVARGALSRQGREEAVSRIAPVASLEAAVDAVGVVIEAVPEDIEVKRSVFEELDRLAPADAVLASNTSAISITLIASWTNRRANVVGAHFFNPPQRMPVVEIVTGLETEERTIERMRALCDRIGMETIVVKDQPGFVTSRLSALIGNEAWHLLMEGVASASDIDRAVKLALGHPMGPFEVGDLVGLDVRLSVLRYLHENLGERFRPCPLLVRYVEAGYLGRKTGRGAYEYHDPPPAPRA